MFKIITIILIYKKLEDFVYFNLIKPLNKTKKINPEETTAKIPSWVDMFKKSKKFLSKLLN